MNAIYIKALAFKNVIDKDENIRTYILNLSLTFTFMVRLKLVSLRVYT